MKQPPLPPDQQHIQPPQPPPHSTESWDHPFFRPAVLSITRPHTPNNDLNPSNVSISSSSRSYSAVSSSAISYTPSSISLSNPASSKKHYLDPNNKPIVRIDQYTLLSTLGQGSMGKVKLAVDPDGLVYAIKIIPRSGHLSNEDDAAAETRVVREASILLLLNHPNIVKLVDALVTQTHFYLVMECIDGPQLLDHVVSNGRLSEDQARPVLLALASAIAYCHRHHIVHRDLKIENILMTKTGVVKLLDFGLANFYDPNTHLHTFCGSLYFASPELISAQPYIGPEVDAWSLGVVLYVLVTARIPFDAVSVPELHARIRSGNPEFPAHVSPLLRDLLCKLLTVDPKLRAGISDVFVHPWVLNYNPKIPTAPKGSDLALAYFSDLGIPPDRYARSSALIRRYGTAPKPPTQPPAPHPPMSRSVTSLLHHMPPTASSQSTSIYGLPSSSLTATKLESELAINFALGPLHDYATVLLLQLTQLSSQDLHRGIGTPDHHLHALHLLVYEWLDRAYVTASAKGLIDSPKQSSTKLASATPPSSCSNGARTANKRTSVALAHAHAVAVRRLSSSTMERNPSLSSIQSLQQQPAATAAPAPQVPYVPKLSSVDESHHAVNRTSSLNSTRLPSREPERRPGASELGKNALARSISTNACLPSAGPTLNDRPQHPRTSTHPPTSAPSAQLSALRSKSSSAMNNKSAKSSSLSTEATAPSIRPSVSPGKASPPPPRVLLNGADLAVSASKLSDPHTRRAPQPTTSHSPKISHEGQQRPDRSVKASTTEHGGAPRIRQGSDTQRSAGTPKPPPAEPSPKRKNTQDPAEDLANDLKPKPSEKVQSPPAEDSAPPPTSYEMNKRYMARKQTSMQSLFAGSKVISLPSGYAQQKDHGQKLDITDPILIITKLAKGMHLEVRGEEDGRVVPEVAPMSSSCLVVHRPSVVVPGDLNDRTMVASVKLTRQGFGLLRPCLAFKHKSGDRDAFRMVVQGLQRQWIRVVVDGEQMDPAEQEGGSDRSNNAENESGGGGNSHVRQSSASIIAAA